MMTPLPTSVTDAELTRCIDRWVQRLGQEAKAAFDFTAHVI